MCWNDHGLPVDDKKIMLSNQNPPPNCFGERILLRFIYKLWHFWSRQMWETQMRGLKMVMNRFCYSSWVHKQVEKKTNSDNYANSDNLCNSLFVEEHCFCFMFLFRNGVFPIFLWVSGSEASCACLNLVPNGLQPGFYQFPSRFWHENTWKLPCETIFLMMPILKRGSYH